MNSNFERESLDRIITLETSLKGQDYKGLNEKLDHISKEQIINQEKLSDLCERITKLEDLSKWMLRTVIGTLIASAIAILFGV